MIDSFVSALVKLADEFKRHGAANIRRDDMDNIRALIIALENELFGRDSYLTIRISVERLLALVEPPVPVFKYKLGVDGFVRAEGARSFRMRDLSYSPSHDEGGGTYRVKPFAYWHPNDRWDVHAEGQGYGFAAEARITPAASLYQGFASPNPERDPPGVNWAALKAGRQEFIYSGFILARILFRRPDLRRGQTQVQPRSNITLDLLSGNYATPFPAASRCRGLFNL